jgi:hypothetical protein
MGETMLALRKPASEPGLCLDEVPVPEPAADEVLVEVETARHLRHRSPHLRLGRVGRRAGSSRR